MSRLVDKNHCTRCRVISTEARHERSGEIWREKQNGKISPLQNLLEQIFPVEMTQRKC